MQSFSQHLVELVLEEQVEFEVAAAAATNRHDFEIAVQQALRRKRAADAGDAPAVDVGDVAEPEDEGPLTLRVASS